MTTRPSPHRPRLRLAIALAVVAGALAGCSSSGHQTTPSSSIPDTVSPTDARAASAIALASPDLARIAGTTPRSVALTGPGSAGTVPDKFLVSVVIKFAQPVRFPAGVPVLRERSEGASPFPLDDAVVTSIDHGLTVTGVTVLVDVDARRVFAFQPGGLP